MLASDIFLNWFFLPFFLNILFFVLHPCLSFIKPAVPYVLLCRPAAHRFCNLIIWRKTTTMLFWPDLGQITHNLKIFPLFFGENAAKTGCCLSGLESVPFLISSSESDKQAILDWTGFISDLFLRNSNCCIGFCLYWTELDNLNPVPDWADWRQHLGECTSLHPSSPEQNYFSSTEPGATTSFLYLKRLHVVSVVKTRLIRKIVKAVIWVGKNTIIWVGKKYFHLGWRKKQTIMACTAEANWAIS